MKQFKNWIICFAATFGIGLILIICTVIVIDPFFQYHKPLSFFPYTIDNDISQNPGMAKNMEYDSVLLGSSMVVNFETNWFDELMGLSTLKLPYNGAYPKDISNIMKVVTESGQQLDTVFYGIDVSYFNGDVKETKYPIPEYLYDTNPWNDIPYLLNKDILLNYILKPLMSGDPATDLSSVYNSEWWMIAFYGKDRVISEYTIPEKCQDICDPDMYIDPLISNLEENIAPMIGDNPNTKFVIFFPPYSILYWYNHMQSNQIDAVLKEYQVAIEYLLQFDNVSLFYFQNMEDTICNLDNYRDYVHYCQAINRYMAECFASGEQLMTQDNYLEELDKMETLAKDYDYNSLFP